MFKNNFKVIYSLNFKYIVLIFLLLSSHSAFSIENKVELIRTISNYHIFKFDNKFYSSLNENIELRNNKIKLEKDMIVDDDIKLLEEKIIKLLNYKPLFHETLASYNIVIYAGKVYGIPQGLTINWNDKTYKKINGLITSSNITDVRNIILKNPLSWKPILIESFFNYNIVQFKNNLYGVPQGYAIDFYTSDLTNNKLLINKDGNFFIKIEIIKQKINKLLF